MAQKKSLSSINLSNLKDILMTERFQNYLEKVNDLMKTDPKFQHISALETDTQTLRDRSIYILVTLFRKLGFTYEDFKKEGVLPNEFLMVFGVTSMDAGTRFGVNFALYTKSLLALGTQKHEYLKKRAFECKDLGCFMLTEMGHGSNVQGILTTANYIHSKRGFIVQTPVDIGMKFWIGNLAQTANMAVLFAQLIVDGENEGVHCFVIRIRDDDGNVLPGMTIGDCGKKMGQNGVDNGWVVFNGLHIPRDALLDRFSSIDENGKFKSQIKKKSQRFAIQISALTGGRLAVSISASLATFAGCSIGTRYCSVRRQFGDKTRPEYSIMEYPLVHSKIAQFNCSALVYFMVPTIILQEWKYVDVFNLHDPRVKELHSISSYIKVASTWSSSQALAKVRELVGGHGYSVYSFLPSLMNYTEVNITWEGSNEILIQQTAKNLLDEFNIFKTKNKIRYQTLQFLQKFEDEQVDIDLAISKIKDFTEMLQTGELRTLIQPLSAERERLSLEDSRKLLSSLLEILPHFKIILQLRLFEMIEKCLAKFALFFTEMSSTKGKLFHSFNKSLPDVLIPCAIFYGELVTFDLYGKLMNFIGDSNAAPPFSNWVPHFKGLPEEKYINEKIFFVKASLIFACSTLFNSDKHLIGVHEAIDYEFFDTFGDLLLVLTDSIQFDLLTFSDFIFPENNAKSTIGDFQGDVYNRIKAEIYARPENFGKSPSWDLIQRLKKES